MLKTPQSGMFYIGWLPLNVKHTSRSWRHLSTSTFKFCFLFASQIPCISHQQLSITFLCHYLFSQIIGANLVQYQVQSLHQIPRANNNTRQRLNMRWGYAQNFPLIKPTSRHQARLNRVPCYGLQNDQSYVHGVREGIYLLILHCTLLCVPFILSCNHECCNQMPLWNQTLKQSTYAHLQDLEFVKILPFLLELSQLCRQVTTVRIEYILISALIRSKFEWRCKTKGR